MTRGEVNRVRIQNYAVYLSTVFPHIVLSWATGVGKTLAAIRIINEDVGKDDYNIWYIVVAETQHIDGWKDEFVKHGMNKLIDLGYVEIFCWASLHKYEGRVANLILDEAHSITSDKLAILSTIKASKIVSLSATIESDKMVLLKVLNANIREYRITVDRAIEAGILPEPKIIKVPIKMDEDRAKEYRSLTDKICTREIQLRDLNLTISLTGGSKKLRNKAAWMEQELLKHRIRRKEVIGNSKVGKAANICYYLRNTENKRIICFTGSVDQADLLGGKLAIHSLLGNGERRTRLHHFQVGNTNAVYTNKMFRQGTNLEKIEAGVIVQVDSKELSFIQMMGRIFRATKPVLYVLVAENTEDEKWWSRCTRDINPKYITTIDDYTKERK